MMPDVEFEYDFVAGKASIRSTRNGRQYRDAKCLARAERIAQACNQTIPDGPLEVIIEAHRKARKGEEHGAAIISKPDVDNIAKLALDALISDDERVVKLGVVRVVGPVEKTIVKIWKYENPCVSRAKVEA